MKKLLLSISILLISAAANAQCTPDAQYASETYGVWPDTVENFPGAMQNTYYSTDLNFKVPVSASDIDPDYPESFTIQSFKVDSVVGLPPGMSYACNIGSCTYPGGSQGCAQITGTCATPGSYYITIYLTAQLNTGFGVAPVEQDFGGYKIDVAVLGLSELIAQSIDMYPNPAVSELSLSGLATHAIESVTIFDANGNKVQEKGTNAYNAITMNVSDLTSGIYFVHLTGAEGIAVKKFVKR